MRFEKICNCLCLGYMIEGVSYKGGIYRKGPKPSHHLKVKIRSWTKKEILYLIVLAVRKDAGSAEPWISVEVLVERFDQETKWCVEQCYFISATWKQTFHSWMEDSEALWKRRIIHQMFPLSFVSSALTPLSSVYVTNVVNLGLGPFSSWMIKS